MEKQDDTSIVANENLEKVTETLEGDHLSIIGQNLEEFSPTWGEKYGAVVKRLDLSYNTIK
jgi:hypothetical protein